MEVFPFTLYCNDKGWSASAYRKAFLSAKPAGLVWYGYDVVVKSRTEVEFVVYDMKDSCWGGLGEEVARLSATVDAKLTEGHVYSRAYQLAEARRSAELQAAEKSIIDGYCNDILAGIGA